MTIEDLHKTVKTLNFTSGVLCFMVVILFVYCYGLQKQLKHTRLQQEANMDIEWMNNDSGIDTSDRLAERLDDLNQWVSDTRRLALQNRIRAEHNACKINSRLGAREYTTYKIGTDGAQNYVYDIRAQLEDMPHRLVINRCSGTPWEMENRL